MHLNDVRGIQHYPVLYQPTKHETKQWENQDSGWLDAWCA